MLGRPAVVASVGATLGEGPFWDDVTARLWFVDIKGDAIFSFDPAQNSVARWSAPTAPGWVLRSEAGHLLVGTKGAIHRFDPAGADFTLVTPVEDDRPGNRLNDATVAPDGTLWFGTMDDGEVEHSGRIYRLDGGAPVDSGLAPVVITNGPAVSPDGRTLYVTDTLGRRIWRVPIGGGNQLGPPELFTEIEEGAGYPDGPTVDAEGCLWTGLFGGWAVRRYSPDGQLIGHVPLPTANVTKLAFGGDGLRTAFVTTARKGLDDSALAAQPNAGHLFAFDAGVAGLPTPRIREGATMTDTGSSGHPAS